MVNPDRVRTKLGDLEEYLRGLREKQDCTLNQYRRDEDRRDIVERRFEKATQASLDIASHIVAAEGFREPHDYGDLSRVLEEESVLPSSAAEAMVEIAGFRNVLAHEYADIENEVSATTYRTSDASRAMRPRSSDSSVNSNPVASRMFRLNDHD
jgi:uncharacterized protein YutE (UPF0331/DUF86 family)